MFAKGGYGGGQAKLKSEQWYAADVSFHRLGSDFAKTFTPKMSELSLGELVVGWFNFYMTQFDVDQHAITVNGGLYLAGATKEPLISKVAYKRYLQEVFADDVIVLTKYADICEGFSFLIVDPFDQTYTPARSVKLGENLDNLYYNFLAETLDSLEYDGELFADLQKKSKKKAHKQKGSKAEQPPV